MLDALGTAGVTLFVLFLLERSSRTASGLRDAALRDGLTGLHNRTLFIDRLEHAMARSQRKSAAAVQPVDDDRGRVPRHRRLQGHQ